ncbi:hypothetical protein R5R35_003000 [Gryllus longicercus]|uniref:Ionotropic receptor n=1 Tax=Gryllus longicercus TaxID=2509291 RepID=A0AAN9Z9D2_9ORTH
MSDTKSRLPLLGNACNESASQQPTNISPFDKTIRYTQSCHIPEFHYYWINKNGKKVVGGPHYTLFKVFKEVTGISFECLTPEPYIFGAEKNGTYNGEIGLLQNGSADITANKFFISYEIFEFADFTLPVVEFSWCITIRKSGEIPFSKVLLLPYKKKVWFSVAGVLLITIIIWHITNTAIQRRPKQSQILSITDCFFKVLQVTLTGACRQCPCIFHQRCLFGALLLFILVLSNGYQGHLLGFLATPPLMEDLQTLQEASENLRHIFAKGLFESVFGGNGASNPTLRNLRKKIKIIKVMEVRKVLDSIVHGADDGILLSRELYYLYSHSPHFTRNGNPVLRLVDECLISPGFSSFVVRKDSPLKNIFMPFVMHVVQGGLYDHWILAYRHLMVANGVLVSEAASDRVKYPFALTLHHVEGAFILMTVGMILSFVTFLLELLIRLICWR